MHTEPETLGCAIIGAPLDESTEILREYVASQEFWIAVVDVAGWALFEMAIRRHYQDAPAEDYFSCVVFYEDTMLAALVLRRRRMTAEKLRFELGKLGFAISARELVEAGVLINVAGVNRARAAKFAQAIGLDPEGDDLGLWA